MAVCQLHSCCMHTHTIPVEKVPGLDCWRGWSGAAGSGCDPLAPPAGWAGLGSWASAQQLPVSVWGQQLPLFQQQ